MSPQSTGNEGVDYDFPFQSLKPRSTDNAFEIPAGDAGPPLDLEKKIWKTVEKAKSSDTSVSLSPLSVPVCL